MYVVLEEMELASNDSQACNRTTKDPCSDYVATQKENISKLIINGPLIVTMVLTIVLNITLIAIINIRPKHRLFTRFFLTSLASVDLCVGLTTMPFSIADEMYDLRYALGPKTCDIFNSLDVMLSSASIIHLGILTFERYVALCKSFSYGMLCNKRTMKLFSLINWVIVIVMSFGTILPGYHEIGVDQEVLHCIMSSVKTCQLIVSPVYAISSSFVSFFLPGILILCFNISVLRHVKTQSTKRKYIVNGIIRNLRPGRLSQSMRVTRTITYLTGCFIFCWLPFFVVNILAGFIEYKIPFPVGMVVLWLGYANSAMNPFLFLRLEGKTCLRKP